CAQPVTVPTGVVRSELAALDTQNGWAVNYPTQHKVFDMAGTLWVFYSDGESIVSTTTDDGVTWSEPQTVRDDAVFGHRMGLWYDGTSIAYAYADALPGGNVYYRRGAPH